MNFAVAPILFQKKGFHSFCDCLICLRVYIPHLLYSVISTPFYTFIRAVGFPSEFYVQVSRICFAWVFLQFANLLGLYSPLKVTVLGAPKPNSVRCGLFTSIPTQYQEEHLFFFNHLLFSFHIFAKFDLIYPFLLFFFL